MTETEADRLDSQHLKLLSSNVAESVGDFLAATQVDLSQIRKTMDRHRQEATVVKDRAISIARNRASQMLIEHSSVVSERAATLVSSPKDSEPSLAVAEYVQLGEFVVGGTSRGSTQRATNAPARIPAVLPLLNHSNLVVRHHGQKAGLEDLLATVIADALRRTAPGQLILHFYDPLLRGTNALFVDLRQAREDLLPDPRTTARDLDSLLDELTNDVIRVNEYFRGRDLTLADLRRESGQLVESYQLVVVRDFPTDVDDQLVRRLFTLIQSGPPCGISFLIDFDVGISTSTRLTPDDFLHHSVLDLDSSAIVSLHQGDLSYVPRAPLTIDAIESQLADLCRAIQGSELPSISFVDLHSAIPRWSRSSADGLTAHIGRAGLDTLSVTLGDERSQRHNILVSGAVGQGKSNLLMALVHSIAWQYSPDEVVMYLLDLKEGLTLSPLAPHPPEDPSFLPHARVLGLESDQAYACAVLSELVHEFEQRAEIIRPHGDNISRYRRGVPQAKMPRILLMIDEFQKLFSDEERWSERALTYLVQLAREGRAYGIHLILASQTLSGITALLSQQDGIFAQFPIRLALKNSSSESQVVLGTDNPDAARLRFRGEIIVNEDFGMVEANRRGIVANAAPQETAKVRRELWARDRTSQPPSVFDGAAPAALEQHLNELHALRDASRTARGERYAVVGSALSISPVLVGAGISTNSGSHLAVIGAGSVLSAHTGRIEAGPRSDRSNLALGALISTVLGLAIQHPRCDARFIFLDLLEAQERDAICFDEVLSTLSHLGISFEYVARTDIPNCVESLSMLIERQNLESDTIYLVGLGLDRVNLTRQDPISGESAVDGMRKYLVSGPGVRAHLIAWWTSMSSFNSALGFEADGEIANALILGVDQSELTGMMGPFVEWKFTPNRGLLHMGGRGEPSVVVPMAPPSSETLKRIREFEWD